MIGLSLSFCIKDIIEGKVNEADVERIIAGTKAETDDHWESVIKRYSQVFWRKDPEAARAVVARLRAAGKFEQPRVNGEQAPNISQGHWFTFRPTFKKVYDDCGVGTCDQFDGQPFNVLKIFTTPTDDIDAESLPMFKIECNGIELSAWPEEVLVEVES